MKNRLKKYIPLLFLIALSVAIYFSPLRSYFTFEELKTNRELLKEMVDTHWFLAPLSFILIYFVITALSFPLGLFLSILGGFLFPQPLSTIYIVFAATTGASVPFLMARTAFGDSLRKKAGTFLQKMEKGFHENKISYLLFIRLVPIFPFWVVNFAPALFGISLWAFVWTTSVGIAPAAFVYAQAGAGLAAIFDEGKEFSFNAVFNWKLRIALIGLGFFALLPVLIKRLKKKWRRD